MRFVILKIKFTDKSNECRTEYLVDCLLYHNDPIVSYLGPTPLKDGELVCSL